MRIRVERSGGFAGMRMATTVDTESLPVDDAQNLSEMIRKIDFFELPAEVKSQKPGADRFHYRLTIEDDGKRHTIETGEADAPRELQTLVRHLLKLSRARARAKTNSR